MKKAEICGWCKREKQIESHVGGKHKKQQQKINFGSALMHSTAIRGSFVSQIKSRMNVRWQEEQEQEAVIHFQV